MSALADTTRSRLLLVLERHELAVSELCAVFQLPQSTMSRHLKVLGDERWVVARAEGTSRRYRMLPDRLDPAAQRLWQLMREQTAALAAADQDAQRVSSVLAQRRSKSQEFFSSAAGEWGQLRSELFGERVDGLALLALLDEGWAVGDLGCGTGEVSASLAPFVRRVMAVDASPEMLVAARQRLGGRPNVEVRRGDLEALPVDDAQLDAAILFLVLHYIVEPERALAEAARVLRPGGRLLVVDMTPHDREEYRQRMGHVWQGFSSEQLGGWLEAAGWTSYRYHPLPADPAAKGPTLFAATAVRVG
jgi:SAM-dependent methyltransferase